MRMSEGSSRSGSRRSGGSRKSSSASSPSTARAKEAARVAELRVEAAAFSKRQFLEEQMFRLKQEEKRLTRWKRRLLSHKPENRP